MSEMTDYQKAVAEHMATAPQELAEYVRGRLPEGELTSSGNPFGYFYIAWQYTSEGYDFWHSVNAKDWQSAMATDFWQKHTAPSEATSQAPSEAPSERPKGIVGQWYTLTSDFNGNWITENRKSGYTWQCERIDDDDEPMIDSVCLVPAESYRLATPEEIAAAQVVQREEEGFEAIRTGGTASQKEVHGLLNFEKPEHEEYDFVNPKHYQEFSVEVIDMMAAIWGKEATALHCEMCAFKYRLRIGSKPNQSIEDELGKINWYMEKAKELRS